MAQITATEPKRIIYFRGYEKQLNSVMITRVCKNYETICGLLEGESATRTLLNLYNLHTVRGCLDITNQLCLDSSMSGPHHYFGYINPYKVHIIKPSQDNKALEFYLVDSIPEIPNLDQIPLDKIITIDKYIWINGCIYKELVNIETGNLETDNLETDSLFENPGVLYLEQRQLLFNILEDGWNYDLSSFRAQLVPNDKPFQFRQDEIKLYKHAQHKLRVITYYYGKNYVDEYLMYSRDTSSHRGNGIFIECHEFIQSITPMSAQCGGFVILGRRSLEGQLDLIGVRIPFGYTLLIEPWAIHGDSTMTGMYMMAMTGNHDAMKTANTVFIKYTDDISNISAISLANKSIDTSANVIIKELIIKELIIKELVIKELESESRNRNMKIEENTHQEDIIMTSDKMSLEDVYKMDNLVKKYIQNIVALYHPLKSIFWQPVIATGTSRIGWNKTLGYYLPGQFLKNC